MITQGEKYLVTADNWFVAPDGEEYRSVWGVCHIKTTEQILGYPQRPSTNWFLVVGEGQNEVIIAGCQIHYVVKSADRPFLKPGIHDMVMTQAHNTVKNKIFFTE